MSAPSIDPDVRYAKMAILDTTVCQSQLAKQIQILDTYKYYTQILHNFLYPDTIAGNA